MPDAPILVIDDSPTLLKLVQMALAGDGHRVETAGNEAEALDAMRRAKPVLILVDDVLADGSTLALCDALTQEAGEDRIPILIMHSGAGELDSALEKHQRVADSISKPFTGDALRAVVAHVLDRPAVPDATPREPRLSLTPAEGVSLGSSDPAPASVALAGDLAVVNLALLLGLLRDQQHDGRLEITHGRAKLHLYLRFGHLVFATAVGVAPEFLLGRILTSRGYLSSNDLEKVLARKRKDKDERLLGTVLISQGHLTADQLAHSVASQTRALVHEAMRWGSGRFAFDVTAPWPASAVDTGVSLPVDRVVMEGLRQVDEWRIIEREIHDFEAVFVREDGRLEALGRGQLMAEEIEIANMVNGRSSIKDIVKQSGRGSFEVSKVLFRLLRAKLIRPRVAAAAV